jgi:hypothetical protein
MTMHIRLLAAVFVLAAGAVSAAAPAHARGGGPANIINSEGYQRALREERQQYQQAQPQTQTQTIAPSGTPTTHRHHKHHQQ